MNKQINSCKLFIWNALALQTELNEIQDTFGVELNNKNNSEND